jgi:hypothetical protein
MNRDSSTCALNVQWKRITCGKTHLFESMTHAENQVNAWVGASDDPCPCETADVCLPRRFDNLNYLLEVDCRQTETIGFNCCLFH